MKHRQQLCALVRRGPRPPLASEPLCAFSVPLQTSLCAKNQTFLFTKSSTNYADPCQGTFVKGRRKRPVTLCAPVSSAPSRNPACKLSVAAHSSMLNACTCLPLPCLTCRDLRRARASGLPVLSFIRHQLYQPGLLRLQHADWMDDARGSQRCQNCHRLAVQQQPGLRGCQLPARLWRRECVLHQPGLHCSS